MPVENYKYQDPAPHNSVINLYADIEVIKLENLINNQIDSILYDDNSFEDHDGDNMMLKAWKDGWIGLQFEDEQLKWEIPVRFLMKKGLKVFSYNVPLIDSWEYSGNLMLRFKTTITFNSDWSLRTFTTADNFEWIKKPSVKIGNTSFPVTYIANSILSTNRKTISEQIDKVVAENMNFKDYADKGWKIMCNPLKVEGDYNAWLSINPSFIAMMPLEGSEGHIRFGATITSNVECLLDNVPKSKPLTPLPEIQMLHSLSDTFHINLLTDIPYTSINRIMTAQMGDSTFVFGNKKIIFESLRVYGSNGKMAVEAKVKGSIKGTLYLTGIPYFNEADTTVRIKELVFDLKSRNLLMTSAKWIFSAKIERTISRSIAIPFKTDIAEIEKQLIASISNRALGYGFELDGRLNRLTVSDLIMAPESVKANIIFSGNLSLGIK